MNYRTAKKIVAQAHPFFYTLEQVNRALRTVRRKNRVSGVCGECPANPQCENFRKCDITCACDVLEAGISHGLWQNRRRW